MCNAGDSPRSDDSDFCEDLGDGLDHSTVRELYNLFQSHAVGYFKIILTIDRQIPGLDGVRGFMEVVSGVYTTPVEYTSIKNFIEYEMGWLINPFLVSVLFKECTGDGIVY